VGPVSRNVSGGVLYNIPLTISTLLDKKTAISRRGCSTRTLILRPAVQMELAGEMVTGEVRANMLASAKACQLLLIVEQSLKPQGLLDLTRDLADTVHAQSGAVIYVAREPLRGRNMFNHIDAQLQLNAAELVAKVTEETEKVCLPARCQWEHRADVVSSLHFWWATGKSKSTMSLISGSM
jgi:NAD-dependent SIR2 family protein deacetylase